ncbi:MAG: histidine--tRNA ligase [Dehalococcoidia bacterium]|nr:histidine--tRNA ligase [Dehalococcoidia bacterium]
MQYRAPRGTTDLLPEEQKYWRYIEATAVDICRRHGFSRLDTPVFEDSRLFIRSVGEGTDIVEKEMYTFQDRGGDSVTLRPEGTAPVCRAYLERGMHNLTQPVRLYYFCPVFRYERPQAGRFREHHQFGVEVLGDSDPSVDANVIEVGWQLMSSLELQGLSLLVNSIGDAQCRPAYVEKLKGYYSGHFSQLCADCRTRLERNPLRLLDCKQPACQALGDDAPRSADHLCPDCQDHWDKLQRYLALMAIPYKEDHRLVRGLDYYTRTVFEIQPLQEGGQSTILGGGRYDALVEQIGGRPTPGIGFATGMERLVLNLKRQEINVPDEPKPEYLVASIGEGTRDAAFHIAFKMRQAGARAILSSGSRSLRGQLRQANALGVQYVVIVGEDELEREQVSVRDMMQSGQEVKPMAQFFEEMNKD